MKNGLQTEENNTKKRYVVINKTRIRDRYTVLTIGLLLSAVIGVLFFANQRWDFGKGEVASFLSLSNVKAVVELDIPNYLPDFLKRPQKIFSGRKLRITLPDSPSPEIVNIINKKTGKTINLTTERKDPRSFTVEIPVNITTGRYTLSFMYHGEKREIPLNIFGLTQAETIPRLKEPLDFLQRRAIRYQTEICSGCYAEAVFTGNPSDSSKLFHVGFFQLSRSNDSGRTWVTSPIDMLTTYPYPDMGGFAGDPKIVALSDGSFFLSGLFDRLIDERSMVGGALGKGSSSDGLILSIFKDIPISAPTSTWLFVDYPKLAVDRVSKSIYISGNAVWFEAAQDYGYGLYTSSDGGKTFKEYELNYIGTAITSVVVGADGTLYAAYWTWTQDDRGDIFYTPTIMRFISIDPPLFATSTIPGYTSFWPVKISSKSDRMWYVYRGPEIIADTNPNSYYYGRLYAIWAQEEKIIADPDFEYPYFSANLDIYVSYSDDKGKTWSRPVRVNDDIGKGDQAFPSAWVDSKGTLHVAFVDHRNHQELPVFDVYYAYSRDGGATFSKNLRINDNPASNPIGGRSIGDYLDMIVAYIDRVYIAYPCGQGEFGPTAACMVQVDPRFVR